MRRLISDDRGVSAVLVALLAVVLFGTAAIVIDLGIVYEERRQLQNGADAAALAIGWECVQEGQPSTNCPEDGTLVLGSTADTYLTGYASANARDGAAEVLATSEVNLGAEDGGWIQVDLESEVPLTPFFGGLLGQGPTTVRASAAVEVVDGSFTPIAFGTCELVYLLDAERIQGVYRDDKGNTEVGFENPNDKKYTFVDTLPVGFAEGDVGEIVFDFGSGDVVTDFGALIAHHESEGNFPFSAEDLIGFQAGEPVNDLCQPNSGGDKQGDAASGNFGWIATDTCAVPLPDSGLSALWIEAQEGSADTQTGCGPDDFEGTIAMMVFDESKDVNTNFPAVYPELASPLCPMDGNGTITCYHAAYILMFELTGWDFSFPGYTPPGCDLAESNTDCVQGHVVDVFAITDAHDELPDSIRLVEPLPNS